MKKTRFTEDQMVTILREADEKSVPEVAKKHGVSAQTIYGWRKHYGTLEPADVQRLRQLEHENVRLKKLVADLTVDIDILKEVNRKKMVGARVRRQQVAYAQGRGLSGRRACALLSVARSTLGYVSRLIARDAPVLPAVRTLVGQYPRYGYRRFGSFSSARATSSASIACIASGARKGCRCPRNARAVAWQPVGRGRSRRRRSITSGRTILCSTRALMAGR
jgi:putative transposase